MGDIRPCPLVTARLHGCMQSYVCKTTVKTFRFWQKIFSSKATSFIIISKCRLCKTGISNSWPVGHSHQPPSTLFAARCDLLTWTNKHLPLCSFVAFFLACFSCSDCIETLNSTPVLQHLHNCCSPH